MEVAVIRVLTLKNQSEIDLHGNLIEENFPEISTVSKCIEGQPNGIHDSKTKNKAIPKIKELAKGLPETEDIKAIFVSCTEDPGVIDIRDELPITVLGAGESLTHISSVVSGSLGLLTIGSQIPEPVNRDLRDEIVMSANIANNTLGLEGEDSYNQALDALAKMEQSGCEAVVLGCTGFSTVGLAKKLGKDTDLPLIDPVIAGGSVLYNLLYSKGGNPGE